MYMTALARQEVAERKRPHHNAASFHASFSRLNGAFFSIYMGSQFSGNLVSSTILLQSDYADTAVVLDTGRC
jgi:hypothetical protein